MILTPIPNFDGYFTDENGNIYSNKPRGVQKGLGNLRKLKMQIQSTGKYFTVHIKKNGDRLNKTQRVHRLVCEAFHGPPPFEKATVSHLDGDWRNNNPKNLKWESYSDNLNRKKEHGTDDVGVKNSRSLINLEILIKIRKLLQENMLTHQQIGDMFGLSRVFITKIANNHRYKNQGV